MIFKKSFEEVCIKQRRKNRDAVFRVSDAELSQILPPGLILRRGL